VGVEKKDHNPKGSLRKPQGWGILGKKTKSLLFHLDKKVACLETFRGKKGRVDLITQKALWGIRREGVKGQKSHHKLLIGNGFSTKETRVPRKNVLWASETGEKEEASMLNWGKKTGPK